MRAYFPATSGNTTNKALALDGRDQSSSSVAIQVGYFKWGSDYYLRCYLAAPAATGGSAVSNQFNLSSSNSVFDVTVRYENTHLLVTDNNNNSTIWDNYNNLTLASGNYTFLIGYSLNAQGATLRPATDLTVYEFYVREI